MFKAVVALVRGKSFEAAERLADANGLVILDQQIRDATHFLDRAKRASAIAHMQDAAEVCRIASVRARIDDLETRALAAMTGGRDDLALEAAEAIAILETDLNSAQAAQTSFARECANLRATTSQAERRLLALERGRRTARAAEAVRQLYAKSNPSSGGGFATLRDAETTLQRLRQRQSEEEAAARATDRSELADNSTLISEKLEAAGFGEISRPSAQSVLARLNQRRLTA